MERGQQPERQGIRTKNVRFGNGSRFKKIKSYAKKGLYAVSAADTVAKLMGGMLGLNISEGIASLLGEFTAKWVSPFIITFGLSLFITERITSRKKFQKVFKKFWGIPYFLLLMLNIILIWNYSLVFSNLKDILSYEAQQFIVQGNYIFDQIGSLISQKQASVAGYARQAFFSPLGLVKGASFAYDAIRTGMNHSIIVGVFAGIAAITKTYSGFLTMMDKFIIFAEQSERTELKVIAVAMGTMRNFITEATYETLRRLGQSTSKIETQEFVKEVTKLITLETSLSEPHKVTGTQLGLTVSEKVSGSVSQLFGDMLTSLWETTTQPLSAIYAGIKYLLSRTVNISYYIGEIINRALNVPNTYTGKIDVEEAAKYIMEPLKESINTIVESVSEEDKIKLMSNLNQPLLFDQNKGVLSDIYRIVERSVYEGIQNIEGNRGIFRSHMVPWESLGLMTVAKMLIILIFILLLFSFGMEKGEEEESVIEEMIENTGSQTEPQPPMPQPPMPRQSIATSYSPPTSPRGTIKKNQTPKYIELPLEQEEYASAQKYMEELQLDKSDSKKLDQIINLLGSLQGSLSNINLLGSLQGSLSKKKNEQENYTGKEEIYYEKMPQKPKKLQSLNLLQSVAGGEPEVAYKETKKRLSPQQRITNYFGSKQ
jgi:hypothetical protein